MTASGACGPSALYASSGPYADDERPSAPSPTQARKAISETWWKTPGSVARSGLPRTMLLSVGRFPSLLSGMEARFSPKRRGVSTRRSARRGGRRSRLQSSEEVAESRPIPERGEIGVLPERVPVAESQGRGPIELVERAVGTAGERVNRRELVGGPRGIRARVRGDRHAEARASPVLLRAVAARKIENGLHEDLRKEPLRRERVLGSRRSRGARPEPGDSELLGEA